MAYFNSALSPSLLALWKDVCRLLGLDAFDVNALQTQDGSIEVRLSKVLRPIDIEARGASEMFEAAIKPIGESVKASPHVRQALVPLEEKLAALTKELASARDEVSQLKPFKVYYELQFALGHGKGIQGIKLGGGL